MLSIEGHILPTVYYFINETVEIHIKIEIKGKFLKII